MAYQYEGEEPCPDYARCDICGAEASSTSEEAAA